MKTICSLATVLFAFSLSFSAMAQDDDDDFFDDDFFFEEEEASNQGIADPLESFNRVMFSFNNKLYRRVLKPVAVAYRVIPEPARVSVGNAIDNLGAPISSANALIQLDMKNAVTEISRFFINSTVGILGLFDPASKMGLVREEEDLGQTLGHYGVGQGFYLVIPFFGSSSLRDGVASFGGNLALNPLLDSMGGGDFILIKLLDAETALSIDKDTYEAFYDSALDPYVFFRSAYTQSREARVEQ